MGKKKASTKRGAAAAASKRSVVATREEELDDRRFDASKPQFRRPSRGGGHPHPGGAASGSSNDNSSTKVSIDERFASVLTDPRFQLDVIEDKYGRRRRRKTKARSVQQEESMSEFYTVQKDAGSPSEKKEAEDEGNDPAAAKSNQEEPGDDDSSSSSSSSDDSDANEHHQEHSNGSRENDSKNDQEEEEDPASRIAYLTALSRGEIDVSSSSSSSSDDQEDAGDDSHSDEDSDDDASAAVQGQVGILDPSYSDSISQENEHGRLTYQEEPTPYLAVQNLDWTNVRAVDIFTILSSFAPTGAVRRVRVYPSDFGKERLAKEAMFGPVDVWKKQKKAKGSDSKDSDDDGDDEDNAKVGRYESEDDGDSDDEELEEDAAPSEHDENASVSQQDDRHQYTPSTTNENGESDFDPEKLRAYEASRLKYYFAVAEFASSEYADMAYQEVDGMEFEHSSAAVDLRAIPVEGLDEVVRNREVRDEATSIPSNYVPPEFVINALQQSNVQCTWDMGDQERETVLTKYESGPTWGEIAEGDDLKAYLASDHSSDEESRQDEDVRASRMRKMLGLDSDDDDDNDDEQDSDDNQKQQKNRKESWVDKSSSESEDDDAEGTREVTFVPGQSKATSNKTGAASKDDGGRAEEELTPWEKYQEKRKQKRKEKRRAAREKRKEVNEMRKGGKPSKQKEDDFFVTDASRDEGTTDANRFSTQQSKQELELLVAGDDHDEEARDFDMRGLERLEKNKDKKLRGARKRKEDKLAANTTGTDFKVDVTDERFSRVLDGTDDRFGIDRTDPNFKETSAMSEILAEQTRRRKKKRKASTPSGVPVADVVVPDVSAETAKASSGSAALSALVSSIKSKVKH